MKFLITVILLIAIEKTARRLNRIRKDAKTMWPEIRRAWILIVFEVGILAVWVALAVFDLRPMIDPMRIAGSLWNRFHR